MTLTIKKDKPGQSPSSYSVILDRSLVIATFDHDEGTGSLPFSVGQQRTSNEPNSMKIVMAATTAGVFG